MQVSSAMTSTSSDWTWTGCSSSIWVSLGWVPFHINDQPLKESYLGSFLPLGVIVWIRFRRQFPEHFGLEIHSYLKFLIVQQILFVVVVCRVVHLQDFPSRSDESHQKRFLCVGKENWRIVRCLNYDEFHLDVGYSQLWALLQLK